MSRDLFLTQRRFSLMKMADLFNHLEKYLQSKTIYFVIVIFTYFTILNAQTTKEEIEHLSDMCNGKDSDACEQLLKIISADKDLDLRFFALNKLTDQNLIAEVVRKVSHLQVKDSALSKINDQDILYKIVIDKNIKDIYRFSALNKLSDQNLIIEVVRKVPHLEVKDSALSKINDQKILYNMVMDKNIKDVYFKKRIIQHIKDENLLINIIQDDSTYDVVSAALENIVDQGLIFSIATSDRYKENHFEAISKLTNKKDLYYVAQYGNDNDREKAVQKINDQNFLIQVVKTDKNKRIQYIAIKKITDQNFLINFINNSNDSNLKEIAIQNITDQKYLKNFINTHSHNYLRELAIRQINNEKTLSEIAYSDSNFNARLVAIELIEDQELLKNIYSKSDNIQIKLGTLDKIRDKDFIIEIARFEANDDLHQKALSILLHVDNPTYYKLLFQDQWLIKSDKLYDLFCPGRNVKTNAVIKDSKIGGVVEIYNSNFLYWCDDAVHKYIGHNENIRDIFSVVESDSIDPLIFRIFQKGYKYERGKGFLIIKTKESHKEFVYKWEGILNLNEYDIKISFSTDRKICLISNLMLTVLDKKNLDASFKQTKTNLKNESDQNGVKFTNENALIEIEFGNSIAFFKDAHFIYDLRNQIHDGTIVQLKRTASFPDKLGTIEGKYDRTTNNFTIVYNNSSKFGYGDNLFNISGTVIVKKIN